jgi:D-glycero-D-manno-heptose 1,7-bisphosphate phosphatase
MRRGLFLDRDGVVNVDRGYVGSRDQFEFMPGLFPFLRAAEDMGFRLAILTNQSGVARGLYSEADFHALTAWMLSEFRRQGILIDLVLGCCEHPEGLPGPYARESYWRKPNPGMVLEAVQRLRLDPARSVFLGDQMRDMQAAEAGGIGHRLLLGQSPATEGAIAVRDFDEALRACLQSPKL